MTNASLSKRPIKSARSTLVRFGLAATLALGGAATVATPVLADAPPARAWEIGPIIKGRNYSVNMPLRPTDTRDGPSFEFPTQGRDFGHVHYVTFDPGSLQNARALTIRYRIDAPRGTRFVAQQDPDSTATLSLFFQRRGDSWTAKGPFEHFRWYSPEETLVPIRPGTYTVTIPLDGRWQSVGYKRSGDHSDAFRASLDNTQRVGFVLGSKTLRGHGVYATQPATFTVLDFEID